MKPPLNTLTWTKCTSRRVDLCSQPPSLNWRESGRVGCMELVKLYTALLRRRWLVIQSVAFFTLAAVLLALVLPKNYKASARVLVSSSDTSMSILSDLGLSEVAAGLSSSADDIQNKINLATTRPVLNEVSGTSSSGTRTDAC
jgi:capsular polysaccharide biosynthesis protein